MQCRKFRKGKKSAKKMRRRKLQKKMQLRKCNVGSCIFSHFPLHLFWCRCIFVCIFFVFFFVKKIQKLIKVAKKMQRRKCNVASCKKNATEKMQRWKLHFFCIFRSVIFGICIFRCIVRFSGFATTSLVVLLGVLTAAYVAYRRRHSD